MGLCRCVNLELLCPHPATSRRQWNAGPEAGKGKEHK